jgi:tetratricopeptide (TPR) repeat protein
MDRKKRLFVLLGVLGLSALASLPWQLKQWQTLRQERRKTAQQEARLQELARTRGATQAARTQMPTDPASRMEAAITLARTGDIQGARPLLRQLEEDSKRIPGMKSQLGDLYRQVGQVDRAYALLSSALQVNPSDPQTLVRMGYLELSLGDRPSGLERFRKAQSAAPTDPEPLLAEALYQDQERSYPQSEVLLKKALALQPERWAVAVLLADNLGKQRRFDLALAQLSALLKSHPGETQILAQQARTLLEAADNQPEKATELRKQAIAALEAAFTLAPGDASLPFELGRAWKALGDNAAALKAWEESFRLKPDYPRLRGQLGQLLLRQGQTERGRQLIEQDNLAEKARTDFSMEVGKAVQSWKDGRARRQLAQWCAEHQQIPRAILEWERLLRDYPGDTVAMREIERLKKSEIQ